MILKKREKDRIYTTMNASGLRGPALSVEFIRASAVALLNGAEESFVLRANVSLCDGRADDGESVTEGAEGAEGTEGAEGESRSV